MILHWLKWSIGLNGAVTMIYYEPNFGQSLHIFVRNLSYYSMQLTLKLHVMMKNIAQMLLNCFPDMPKKEALGYMLRAKIKVPTTINIKKS